MNNFVGDGNGYVGNPDLKPEIAHTLSVTGDWHSADRSDQFKVTPYYTRVNDYIDASHAGPSDGVMARDERPTRPGEQLRQAAIRQSGRHGSTASTCPATCRWPGLAWARLGPEGPAQLHQWQEPDTGDELYNIMPLNAKVDADPAARRLGQQPSNWSAVAAKDDVSSTCATRSRRPATGCQPARQLLLARVRLDFGVENLVDRLYYLPLGGAYTGQGATMSLDREVGAVVSSGGTATTWGTAVPGPGRSFYAGINVKF